MIWFSFSVSFCFLLPRVGCQNRDKGMASVARPRAWRGRLFPLRMSGVSKPPSTVHSGSRAYVAAVTSDVSLMLLGFSFGIFVHNYACATCGWGPGNAWGCDEQIAQGI